MVLYNNTVRLIVVYSVLYKETGEDYLPSNWQYQVKEILLIYITSVPQRVASYQEIFKTLLFGAWKKGIDRTTDSEKSHGTCLKWRNEEIYML